MWPRPNAQLSWVDVYVWHYDYVLVCVLRRNHWRLSKQKQTSLVICIKIPTSYHDLADECDRHNQSWTQDFLLFLLSRKQLVFFISLQVALTLRYFYFLRKAVWSEICAKWNTNFFSTNIHFTLFLQIKRLYFHESRVKWETC